MDANFIKPNTKLIVTGKNKEVQHSNVYNLDYDSLTKIDTHTYTVTIGLGEQEEEYLETNYGYSKDKEIEYDDGKVTASIIGTGTQFHVKAWRGDNGKAYVCNREDTSVSNGLQSNVTLTIYEGNYNAVDPNGSHVVKETDGKTSTAAQLQQSISTWYKTLRMIAIVGLLSVLVYVGIRILISSTGQDKAKYKKMLTDWVAAMCILFLLQYVMVFTMEMTEKITGIFAEANGKGLFNEDGSDKLISTARGQMKADPNNGYVNSSFMEMFSWLIIYLVLVIYTCVFIWQYLKRVVMLAFLTMVAPLIALTYPLDKIKDGQAQAFGLWMREYIFNALLPIIHIVIYYMLVGSAIDFITDGGNWLYAIVAVGFVIPAEKFFRKMFGFDKATSVGQLGAAAGGAMVMNAINKLGSKGGSGKSSGGSSDSGSGKTKSSTRFIQPPGGNQPGENPPGENPPGGNQPGENPPGGNQPGENPPGGNQQPQGPQPYNGQPLGAPNYGQTVESGQPKPAWSVAGVKAGLKGVGKKYINKPNAVKAGKWAGRKFRRAAFGAAGAAALGTFGLAAGIASGDVSNVFKYGGAAALVGAKGANSLGDKLTNIEKQNREEFKENVWGTDEYNMRNSVKELNMDSDFIKTCNQLNLNKDEREDAIRMFHANGITNSEDIKNAMEVRARNGVSQEKIVAATKLHKSLSKSYWGQPKNKNDFKQNLIRQGVNPSEAEEAIKLIGDLKGDLS